MIEPNEDLEKDFASYIEHLAKGLMKKAELELTKLRECQEMLELPPRRENWSAQENAENSMEERMNNIFSYLQQVAVLTKGLEVFKNGLIYNAMKSSNKVKVK